MYYDEVEQELYSMTKGRRLLYELLGDAPISDKLRESLVHVFACARELVCTLLHTKAKELTLCFLSLSLSIG